MTQSTDIFTFSKKQHLSNTPGICLPWGNAASQEGQPVCKKNRKGALHPVGMAHGHSALCRAGGGKCAHGSGGPRIFFYPCIFMYS